MEERTHKHTHTQTVRTKSCNNNRVMELVDKRQR